MAAAEDGFRRHIVSMAKLWSVITRRLGRAADLTDWLTPVAYYLCIDYCAMLVAGRPDGLAGPDVVAAGDCPLTVDEIKALREQLRHMRDTILHIGTMTAPGTVVRANHDEHGDIVYSTVRFERKVRREPEIRRSEIEATLDQLDPWLQRQFDRIVNAP